MYFEFTCLPNHSNFFQNTHISQPTAYTLPYAIITHWVQLKLPIYERVHPLAYRQPTRTHIYIVNRLFLPQPSWVANSAHLGEGPGACPQFMLRYWLDWSSAGPESNQRDSKFELNASVVSRVHYLVAVFSGLCFLQSLYSLWGVLWAREVRQWNNFSLMVQHSIVSVLWEALSLCDKHSLPQ